jgi:hypothetical protein
MNDGHSFLRLVVKFKDHLNLPFHEAEEIGHYFSQNDLLPFKFLLENFIGLKTGKIFTSLKPQQVIDLTEQAGIQDRDYQAPNFLNYYFIDCPYVEFSNEIIQVLKRNDNVELAYVETSSEIPPSTAEVTNQLSYHQGYLKPAPNGIDACYAWIKEGGNGEGLKFIDIEQGWIFDSEKFSIGTFPFTGINVPNFKDHGEAVLGVILTQHKLSGGKGIAPNANCHVISQWRPDGSFNTADAIMAAISQLDYGDILLLEAQVYDSPECESLWPVEIQPAVFDVIRLASALGIIVIEAAGNGKKSFGEGNDLDNFTDRHGKNTLHRRSPDFRDSGAILVAAASNSIPHKKIRHSNFGNRIDCYAWGEYVSAEGSHLGSSELAIDSYRKKINGTSGSAAIITGAAIIVQSITESNYHFRLSPKEMRGILSNELLGTASANGHSIDRLGVMPDLRKIIDYIHLLSPALKEADKTIYKSNSKKISFQMS